MMKRNKNSLLCLLLMLAGVYAGCNAPVTTEPHAETEKNDTGFNADGWTAEQVLPDELAAWQLLGDGKVASVMGEQVSLEETGQSKGVMLLSPRYYEGDVVVRYKALALSPATVFVTVLSAKDQSGDQLTVPGNYDGTMGFWTSETRNYFFAFKNAPHGGTPFITKNPAAEKQANAPGQDGMIAGVYYDIEAGREGTKLWLSIDGKEVVNMVDDSLITGGHIAFRLRGTAGLPAIGLIKDLSIYTK